MNPELLNPSVEDRRSLRTPSPGASSRPQSSLEPLRKVKLHPLDAASRLGSELDSDKVSELVTVMDSKGHWVLVFEGSVPMGT